MPLNAIKCLFTSANKLAWFAYCPIVNKGKKTCEIVQGILNKNAVLWGRRKRKQFMTSEPHRNSACCASVAADVVSVARSDAF